MKRRPLSRASPPPAGSARSSALKAAAAFGLPMSGTSDMSRAVSLPSAKASRLKHPQHHEHHQQQQHKHQQQPQRRSQDDDDGSERPAENGVNLPRAGALQIASGQTESQSLPYQSLQKASSDIRDPIASLQTSPSPFGRPARRPSASRLSRGGSVQSSSSIMSPAAPGTRGPSISQNLYDMGAAPLTPASNASPLRSPFAFNPLSGDSASPASSRNHSIPIASYVPLTMQSLQSHNAQADSFSPMDLSNAPERLLLEPIATSSSLPIPHLQPSIKVPLPDFAARGFSLARPSRLSTMSSDADADVAPTAATASGELTMDEMINRVRIEYQREAALQQILPFPPLDPSYRPQSPPNQAPSDPMPASSIADDPNTITTSWLSSISAAPKGIGPPLKQWKLPLGLFPSSMSEAAEICPPEGLTMPILQHSLMNGSLPLSASSEGLEDEEDRARNKDPRSLDSAFNPFSPTLPFAARLRSVTESCDSRVGSFLDGGPRQNDNPRQMSRAAIQQQQEQMPSNGRDEHSSQPQSSATERPHQLTSPFANSPSRNPSLKGSQAFSEAAHARSSMPHGQQHNSQRLSGDDNQTQPRGLQRQLGQTFPQRANSTSTYASSSNFPEISPQDIPKAKQRPDKFFHQIHTLPSVRASSVIRESEEGGPESNRSSATGNGAAGSSFSELVQEIAVMKKLAHPNIVKLHEVRASRRGG